MVFGLFPRPHCSKPLWLNTSDHSASDIICLSNSLTSPTVSSLSLNVSIPQGLTWAFCISTEIFPIYPPMSMSSTITSLHSTLKCRKSAQIFLSSSTNISNATCNGYPAIASDSILLARSLPYLSLPKLSPYSDFFISTRDAQLPLG